MALSLNGKHERSPGARTDDLGPCDDELFAEERLIMKGGVVTVFRFAEDRDFEFAAAKRFELRRRGIENLDADPGMARAHAGDKLDQIPGCDGSHDSKLQLSLLQARELAGTLCSEACLLVDFVDVWLDDAAEFGEMGLVALAVEQSSPELLLKQSYRSGQRRLGYLGGCASEVELFDKCTKIADLAISKGRSPFGNERILQSGTPIFEKLQSVPRCVQGPRMGRSQSACHAQIR
jgi:hypothetical protein